MNEPKKVTAAILRKDGKILIAKRQSGDAFEGKWEFPGGKIKKGETPEQCLKRELLEELGIDADIGGLLYIIPYDYIEDSILLFAYNVAEFDESIKMHAHSEIKWVEASKLYLYDFLDANRLILERIIRENNRHAGRPIVK